MVVFDADDNCTGDGGMVGETFLDFEGVDVLTTYVCVGTSVSFAECEACKVND